MLNALIELSLKYRVIVLLLGVVLVVTGVYAAVKLPLDAFPDTTPVQVQVHTAAPALGAEEVEQQITLPLERELSALPGLQSVRSLSKFGFSQITFTFADAVDIYFARELVQQRLQTVELPAGIARPVMGPVSTGLGEVYNYLVKRPTPPGMTDEENLTELRTIQDWLVKPRLRELPGVAEINSWGGFEKQYHVEIDPARLVKFGLTLEQVTESLQKNNGNVGGGVLEQAGEAQIVKGVGIVSTVEEIADIVLASHDGVPVRVRDVADVTIGHAIRRGAVTMTERAASQELRVESQNGADADDRPSVDAMHDSPLTPGAPGSRRLDTHHSPLTPHSLRSHETVLGLGYMLMGENSRVVTQRLDQRLAEIQGSLPEGVTLEPVYKRTDLVNQVLMTVRTNLFEAALLVIAVLFAFLGNLRAGLIVASAIPLSLLCAGNLMLQFGVAGTLLSLGAIDFGLIVDSSVVMVENCVRHLAEDQSGRSKLAIVRDAALEVRKPTMFGELIIMIVYLPILTLEGIEGKLFRPMALTVIFALAGSLVLSLTLIPALASLFLPRHIKHRQPLVDRLAHAVFQPVLKLGLRYPWTTLTLTSIATVATTILGLFLGAEFIPELQEGAIEITTVRLSGVSLEESNRYSMRIERVLLAEFPDEIHHIWTRTGAAELAADPMGLEVSDVFIMFQPRERWRRAGTQEELTAQMVAALEKLPGMRLFPGQPIEMRVNEMSVGVRADVGVLIFGDDLEELKSKQAEVLAALKQVPGAANVTSEQITGQPVLEAKVNADAIARYGVSRRDVLDLIESIGGIRVGEIREGQRRFPLVAKLAAAYRSDADALDRIVVPTAAGQRIPLGQLVDFERTTGPATITRDNGRRRILVQCNVRGRDLESFVREAQQRINPLVQYPLSVAWSGQFEHLERARARLWIVVPTALFLIFMLLYISLGSVRDSLMVFSGVLFARIGGVLGLWIRGMPFSISAGVGFVALAGAAMLEGLVLVSYIRRLIAGGLPKREAIEQARLIRLRPVLMTGLVAALGFVPMAFSTGVGSEVQRPLATVIVFGIASDTILTMLVLPVMYLLFGKGPSGDGEMAD
jgi:cobalt-zinc-cadmium resistance protein CzcA